MYKLIKKMKNRIKSSNGMSLGEILVSVLIILLATSVLVGAVNLGVRHYTKSLSDSEANTLSSTLQSVLTNELAYTTEIQVADPTAEESDVVCFQSQNYAVEGNLSGLSTADADSGGYGKVMIGKAGDAVGTTNLKLLGDGAYPNHIGVNIKSFKYKQTTSTFTLEISIGCKNTDYLDQTFQVINVNKTKPSQG